MNYGTTVLFERSGDLLVAGTKPMSQWVLERDVDPSGGYCYLYVAKVSRPLNAHFFSMYTVASVQRTTVNWYSPGIQGLISMGITW